MRPTEKMKKLVGRKVKVRQTYYKWPHRGSAARALARNEWVESYHYTEGVLLEIVRDKDLEDLLQSFDGPDRGECWDLVIARKDRDKPLYISVDKTTIVKEA